MLTYCFWLEKQLSNVVLEKWLFSTLIIRVGRVMTSKTFLFTAHDSYFAQETYSELQCVPPVLPEQPEQLSLG